MTDLQSAWRGRLLKTQASHSGLRTTKQQHVSYWVQLYFLCGFFVPANYQTERAAVGQGIQAHVRGVLQSHDVAARPYKFTGPGEEHHHVGTRYQGWVGPARGQGH